MSNTVTVACKTPNGLLLRNFKMVEHHEMVMGGGRKKTTRAEQVGETVRIHGTAVPFGKTPPCLIVGGYALTPGIDAEFFTAWIDANADLDAVKNGLVFAHETESFVADQAKECKGLRSGLEPLNPARVIKDGKSVPVDPRFPKQVETVTEDAA